GIGLPEAGLTLMPLQDRQVFETVNSYLFTIVRNSSAVLEFFRWLQWRHAGTRFSISFVPPRDKMNVPWFRYNVTYRSSPGVPRGSRKISGDAAHRRRRQSFR